MKAQAKTLPYTYFIKWTGQNKWYYGVRYAKGCHPSEFWNKYFTSSTHVKKLLNEFGNPDVIQIRKTFSSAEKAIVWEKKVLEKMKVLKRDDSLNMNIAGSIVISPEMYMNIAQKRKSSRSSYNNWDQSKEKNSMWGNCWITNGIMSKVVKKDTVIPNGWYAGRVIDLSKRKNDAPSSNIKNSIWITNGIKNKRINPVEIILSDWYKGHTVKDKNAIKGSANTIWITNNIENKKIHKTSLIPEGWNRGRSNIFPGSRGDK